MALFRRTTSSPEPADPAPVAEPASPGPAKKDRPTPTRKEAEAARRQRVTRNLSPREARREAAARNRAERMRALAARDATPEKQLLRDYVDYRWNLGEFLLPSVVVILAASFLGALNPNISFFTMVLMYLFILGVLVDGFLMWRGFKKLLARRLPKSSSRGLFMYGMNRAIQIRRFRIPPPRIKRGQAF